MKLNKELNKKPLAGLISVAAIGGASSPLAKYALKEIPPWGYTFVRLLAGSILMIVLMYFSRIRPDWKRFKLFAPIATFWWLNALIFTFGLQKTDPTTAQFIHISVPILTALLAIFILREKLSNKQWLGSLIAACGVAVVVFSKGDVSIQNHNLIGNLLILGSAIIFSIYAIYSKDKKFDRFNAIEMVFIASTCGAVASFVPAAIEYSNNKWLGSVSPSAILAMLGAVATISLFYVGFQRLIQRFGPSIATTNLYLLPIFVIIWAAIILDEKVASTAFWGALLTVAGISIFSHYSRRT